MKNFNLLGKRMVKAGLSEGQISLLKERMAQDILDDLRRDGFLIFCEKNNLILKENQRKDIRRVEAFLESYGISMMILLTTFIPQTFTVEVGLAQ